MRRCSAKPYEGNENYIFVSYCHKDKAKVFPIIEHLARTGYRVWYDEGIDPGSEWPEIIARHLNGCALCIAFISENSLNSHNCRREINFALLKKKFFISVVLEPVQMSLGMEMQLSSSQSIFKYTLSSDNDFFMKLYSARELESCLGVPDYSIRVSTEADYRRDNNEFDKVRDPFSDKWFVSENRMERDRPVPDAYEEEKRLKEEAEARRIAEEKRLKEEAEARRIAEEKRLKEEAEARRIAEEKRLKEEAEARRIAEEKRLKEEAEARRIAEEKRLKEEAEARRIAEEKRLKEEAEARRIAEEKRLKEEAEARRIAEENARRREMLEKQYLIEQEKRKEEEAKRKKAIAEAPTVLRVPPVKHVLLRRNTNEVVEINKERFIIGRSSTGSDYVIHDNQSISRMHAIFTIENAVCYVSDNKSLNKTYLNGQMLTPEMKYTLKEGDMVRLYNENFIYRIIKPEMNK